MRNACPQKLQRRRVAFFSKSSLCRPCYASAMRNARSQLPVRNLRTTTRNFFFGMPLLQTPTGGNTVVFPFMLFDAKSTLLHACPRGHQYTDKARCTRRHARRLLPHACTQHTRAHAHMLRENRALERARESVCANVRLFLCEYACMYVCLCVSVCLCICLCVPPSVCARERACACTLSDGVAV